MIIGTAGHIDHGKTALIRALTGIDTDRLPEEKRRGMTIDLGFAYRRLQPTPEDRNEAVLAFIDVPGHERFIHNMLADASGIDFVLLAIAADDGPMPQTREHLDIVSLLGVERGVVALTKADLVSPDRLAHSEAEVREFLAGSVLRDSAILPVSSVTGEGIPALGQCLINAAGTLSIREPKGGVRFSIDRSFVLAGGGIVVTGTVAAVSISVGERAVLSPSGIDLRIRGIQAHNRPARCAQAGQRCALNLAGADLDRQRVRRGDWVVAPSLHAPTTRLDTQLRLLHHDRPLKPGISVHLHLGAARVGARIMPLTDATLDGNADLPARFALDYPIAAWRGDRFILRDASATRTVGGGMVLDPCPPNRGRRRPERLAALAALAKPEPEQALIQLSNLSPTGVDLDRFALSAGLTQAELRMAYHMGGARLESGSASLRLCAVACPLFGTAA
jgi:selenocysteine-specific elongation factor